MRPISTDPAEAERQIDPESRLVVILIFVVFISFSSHFLSGPDVVIRLTNRALLNGSGVPASGPFCTSYSPERRKLGESLLSVVHNSCAESGRTFWRNRVVRKERRLSRSAQVPARVRVNERR